MAVHHAEDTPSHEKHFAGAGMLVIGALLVLAGIVFLFFEFAGISIDIGEDFWPFFIIVPGLVVFALAFGMSGKRGQDTAAAGSVITTVGLLLWIQNWFDLWATWAYAWALVAPTSIGVGQAVYGAIKGEPELMRSGLRLATIGFLIFLVLAAFFELVIGLSGFVVSRYGLPILLIAAGLLVLVLAFLRSRSSADDER